MVEDDVLRHLRPLLQRNAQPEIASCRISTPLQPPWGRPYRLVEWTVQHTDGPRRQVVPAESTPLEIARALAAHVPGRVVLLNGEAG